MSEMSAIAAFAWIARARSLAAKSHADAARDYLTANRLPAQMERVVKAAIGAVGTGDATLGTEGISISDWSNSARTASAFYRILADGAFIRLPFNTRAAMLTSSPTAAVVAEGKAIPVSKSVLNNVVLAPQKVASLMVVTDDLLFRVDAGGQQMFGRELLNVVAGAVDTAFLDKIDTGLTPITSTNPMADIRAALLAVTGSTVPRPYWVGAADVARLGATATTSKNGALFAAVSVVGGELGNIPLLVSSAVPSGMLYLVDAAQIVAEGVSPVIEVSRQADIQMDTAPTMASDVPTGTTVVNMFQTNNTALRAVAVFACEKLRSSAVAVISGITSSTWPTT